MTIPLNQTQNRIQNQAFGLSSLNESYLNRFAPVISSVSLKPAQNAPTNYVPNTSRPISNPNSAYMPGVGAVPSGYFMPGEEHHSSEDRIIKKTPLTGARIMADKLTKGALLYAPKGMQGSKNSNFYEFLSLGIIPNIIGSGMLIATFGAAVNNFNKNDATAARFTRKNAIMGVLLYATMKWAANKLMNKGIKLATGVDIEMPYKKVISELPENGKARTTTEFHRVFESVDFPRWDLINNEGEQNGNRYEYYDKIAKEKLGCDEPLNAPDQVVQPLIKKALVKGMAAKSITSFLWAATGVAIAAQESCSKYLNFKRAPKKLEMIGAAVKELPTALYNSTKELWKGKTALSGLVGKSLVVASVATAVLGLINVRRGYKIDKQQSKSKIDYTKDYTEN